MFVLQYVLWFGRERDPLVMHPGITHHSPIMGAVSVVMMLYRWFCRCFFYTHKTTKESENATQLHLQHHLEKKIHQTRG
jgi:hypothetical protein